MDGRMKKKVGILHFALDLVKKTEKFGLQCKEKRLITIYNIDT